MTDEEKKMRQAILRGAQLMVDNGLGSWKIRLHNKRTTLADCHNTFKTIRYSKHFLKVADKDQFDGVTFHEITHALLPAGAGHGNEFVNKCIEISPTADYAKRSVEVGIFKFKITCPECGVVGGSNRVRKSLCKKCHEKGTMAEFKFEENKLLVNVW